MQVFPRPPTMGVACPHLGVYYTLPALPIALDLGDIRLGNTVMLGAIADHLPFSADVLRECVLQRFTRKGEKVVKQNRRAFTAGRAAVGAAQAEAARFW